MTILIFLVIVLFLLAIADLIVGVSNDAVNFLNSAIGSKVAKFRTIILVAAAGVIIGSLFSSGIMEIARKGVFHPQYFTLTQILFVFLAVMLTDIILLDLFNTLGLPTSTTVSIIFELLGASLMTGILISIQHDQPVSAMMKYINSDSVLTIIVGIVLSVMIAFTAGAVIQYFCRLLFTFDYEANLKKFGAVFAGLGITAIVYFLVFKGLKGTTLLDAGTSNWIIRNSLPILAVIFAVSTLISALLQALAGINPLKVVVLMGTFSLAMAFAGNDLVNFIGVPITGFLAFRNWQHSGVPANEHYQDYLASSDVLVPNYMLFGAGVVMALTLWFNAKARKVTETSVKLGSQNEEEEKFKPNNISRRIVRTSMRLSHILSFLVPRSFSAKYNLSFEKSKLKQATLVHDKPAFDLVRAVANLVIASILIAWATSMKLPLSTTYVSFMVAMGTSLADKAWGSESAVYRVAGVLSVIGGWFITAIIAFSVSAIFALLLFKTGFTGALALLLSTGAYIYYSQVSFTLKEKASKEKSSKLLLQEEPDSGIMEGNKKRVADTLLEISEAYGNTIDALSGSQKGKLDKTFLKLKELEEYSFSLRSQSIRYIKGLQTDDHRAAELLLYGSDLLQDITSSCRIMGEECLHYVKNLHREPDPAFIEVCRELKNKMQEFMRRVAATISGSSPADLEQLKTARNDVRQYINEQLDKQVQMIRVEKPGVKQALLQSTVLLQSRDILAVTLRILKMYKSYLQ